MELFSNLCLEFMQPCYVDYFFRWWEMGVAMGNLVKLWPFFDTQSRTVDDF